MRRLLAVAAAALACAAGARCEEEQRYSCDDVYVMVAADLRALPREQAAYSRYIALRMHPEPEERETWARLITAHIHDLKLTRGIFPLLPAKTAPEALGVHRVPPCLLRFNLLDFGRRFEVQWEKLGAVEPFFHGDGLVAADVEKEVDVGLYYDSRGNAYGEDGPGRTWRRTGTQRRVVKGPKKKHGFFLRTKEGKAAFLELQQRMVGPNGAYGTDNPVIDADFVLNQTLIDFERKPGYHDFLGYDNLEEYEKLIGFTRRADIVDETFLQELNAAFAGSKVLQKDAIRRVVHFDKPGGDYWLTQDSNQRTAKFDPQANPLKELGIRYKFQAIEAMGHKADGFIAKGLFDNRGVRQDRAPDNIAHDNTAPYNDKRVHNGQCMRCHKTGFQDFKDWVSGKYNTLNPNLLAAKDPREALDVRRRYMEERLEPYLDSSRNRYSVAMQRCVGWTPTQFSDALDAGWKQYVEDDVSLAVLSRRLGVSDKKFQEALLALPLIAELKAKGKAVEEIAAAVAAATHSMDITLSVYRPGEEERLPVVVVQEVFQRAADAVYGVVEPFDVRGRDD